jgi:hypothetical protein
MRLPASNVPGHWRSTDVVTAAGDIDDLPTPLVLGPGVERPSTVLARLRRDER